MRMRLRVGAGDGSNERGGTRLAGKGMVTLYERGWWIEARRVWRSFK